MLEQLAAACHVALLLFQQGEHPSGLSRGSGDWEIEIKFPDEESDFSRRCVRTCCGTTQLSARWVPWDLSTGTKQQGRETCVPLYLVSSVRARGAVLDRDKQFFLLCTARCCCRRCHPERILRMRRALHVLPIRFHGVVLNWTKEEICFFFFSSKASPLCFIWSICMCVCIYIYIYTCVV